ncbi:hypothetical protein F511_18813 [Dorcoceras hygrometricum]|uniref:Uncharacterized protein n=1 Tax=Dorcoceras hygrometricum TaxID=472368 RepID=A0A2Z7CND9_9LAMI|nr:hypothetical protein F511_18813 [Dorcoceras hygrometricum]
MLPAAQRLRAKEAADGRPLGARPGRANSGASVASIAHYLQQRPPSSFRNRSAIMLPAAQRLRAKEAADHATLITTLLATRAWLRPVSRGNRHFMVDCGRQRQSGPRPETGFLHQPALEGLTRSARTDSPRQDWPEQFSGERRRRAMAAARREVGEERGRRFKSRVRV